MQSFHLSLNWLKIWKVLSQLKEKDFREWFQWFILNLQLNITQHTQDNCQSYLMIWNSLSTYVFTSLRAPFETLPPHTFNLPSLLRHFLRLLLSKSALGVETLPPPKGPKIGLTLRPQEKSGEHVWAIRFIYVNGPPKGITVNKEFPFYHIDKYASVHIKCPTLESGGKWFKANYLVTNLNQFCQKSLPPMKNPIGYTFDRYYVITYNF